jgi:hypothetical protein
VEAETWSQQKTAMGLLDDFHVLLAERADSEDGEFVDRGHPAVAAHRSSAEAGEIRCLSGDLLPINQRFNAW